MQNLNVTDTDIQSVTASVRRFPEPAHVIVFGNEKGGSGKSTSAMHTAIALVRAGYDVGTIDLDARQGTLTRYIRNRFKYMQGKQQAIPSPRHMAIERSRAPNEEARQAEEKSFFELAMDQLGRSCDFVVIDTPGTDSYLSRLAHSRADTLVTPMNDSFIDLDVLAEIDPETHGVRALSVYAKMVREQFAARREKDGFEPQWIVMRNRLSHIDALNKRQMAAIIENISRLQNFKTAPGFGERVIFRELFLKGLTLLDMKEEGESLSLSHVAARQEVRQLVAAIGPERFKTPRAVS